MSKAPFILTAAVMLAVFLCLGNANVFAQCAEKICLEDPTCSGPSDDACDTPNGNCASQAFTAQCTGTYQLKALLLCQFNCHLCEVCVMVEEVSTHKILATCSSVCSNQICNQNCSVDLVQGEAYFLWVCKTPCQGSTCEDCTNTDCNAYGCLCYAITNCAP